MRESTGNTYGNDLIGSFFTPPVFNASAALKVKGTHYIFDEFDHVFFCGVINC